jgi:hypothetical protein
MGRTLQKLINYNTNLVYSGFTDGDNLVNLEKLNLGEIVVGHNPDQPLLGIRISSGETPSIDHFAWFMDSAAVVTAINAVAGTAGSLQQDLATLSGATSAFSATVFEYYATKAEVSGHVGTIVSGLTVEAITGSSSQTITSVSENNGKIEVEYSPIAIEKSQVNGLDAIETQVTNNKTAIEELSGVTSGIAETYATKSEVSGHVKTEIEKLDVAGISGSTSGTVVVISEEDGKVKVEYEPIFIQQNQVSGLTELATQVGTNKTDISELSASVRTTLSRVYKVKGSVDTYDDLPNNAEVGDVYNVIAAQGTKGNADYVPAGTNYVWVGTEGTIAEHWDALGGTFDLTGYALSANTWEAIKSVSGDAETAINAVSQNLKDHINDYYEPLSGLVNAISATVTSDYATKDDVADSFTGLDMTQIDILPSETLEYIKEEDGIVSAKTQAIAIVTSAITDFGTFSSELTAATQNISNLSAATETIEDKANESISAVTTGAVSEPNNTTNTVNASGVKIQNDNTNRGVTFDFSELIIDCGTF